MQKCPQRNVLRPHVPRRCTRPFRRSFVDMSEAWLEWNIHGYLPAQRVHAMHRTPLQHTERRLHTTRWRSSCYAPSERVHGTTVHVWYAGDSMTTQPAIQDRKTSPIAPKTACALCSVVFCRSPVLAVQGMRFLLAPGTLHCSRRIDEALTSSGSLRRRTLTPCTDRSGSHARVQGKYTVGSRRAHVAIHLACGQETFVCALPQAHAMARRFDPTTMVSTTLGWFLSAATNVPVWRIPASMRIRWTKSRLQRSVAVCLVWSANRSLHWMMRVVMDLQENGLG